MYFCWKSDIFIYTKILFLNRKYFFLNSQNHHQKQQRQRRQQQQQEQQQQPPVPSLSFSDDGGSVINTQRIVSYTLPQVGERLRIKIMIIFIFLQTISSLVILLWKYSSIVANNNIYRFILQFLQFISVWIFFSFVWVW